jgi:YD repeat-containing protein
VSGSGQPGKTHGPAGLAGHGTTTTYDARGNIIGRESTSGNTTTIYDGARPKRRAVQDEPLNRGRAFIRRLPLSRRASESPLLSKSKNREIVVELSLN